MKWRAPGLAALLAAVVLVGCVVISGQRVTLHYDEASDRLSLLVQYDGVFESASMVSDESLHTLREFVAGSRVMLVDWFGELDPERLSSAAETEKTPPRTRVFLEHLLDELSVRNLGRTRDPDGRVGAAQLVTLDHASAVLRNANAAIGEQLLRERSDSPTLRRLQKAALEDRQWLSLDGHSLVLSFPIEPGEWAGIRRSLLIDLAKEWAEEHEKDARKPEALDPDFVQRLLASGPWSIEQTSEEVVVRVGEREKPSTFRCALRDGYRPNLEEELARLVPGDVDRALADRLLSEPRPTATGTSAREPGRRPLQRSSPSPRGSGASTAGRAPVEVPLGRARDEDPEAGQPSQREPRPPRRPARPPPRRRRRARSWSRSRRAPEVGPPRRNHRPAWSRDETSYSTQEKPKKAIHPSGFIVVSYWSPSRMLSTKSLPVDWTSCEVERPEVSPSGHS